MTMNVEKLTFNNIWLFLPCYNEAENLPKLVKTIFNLQIPDLNIIVVDDNSPDGTGQIADRLAKEFSLIVIHRQGKQGLGSACITGFKKALELGAEIVCQMDADFSHDPAAIPQVYED